MVKAKSTKQQTRSTQHITENKRLRNPNPSKTFMNAGAPIGRSVPTPLVALVVLLLLKSDGMPITMSTKGSHSWLFVTHTFHNG